MPLHGRHEHRTLFSLRTILIVVVLAVGIVAAFGSRFAALLLYIWFALFRPQEWVWIDITSLRLSFVLGLLLVVPSLVTGVFPNLTHPLSVGTLAFLASALIAQIDAVNPAVGWEWIDFFARLVLVCLLTVTLTTTRQRFIAVLGVIAGSFGFHGAKAGLGFLLGGGARFHEGLGGSFTDNNAYALAITSIMPMLFAVAQNISHRWTRLAFLAAVPLSVFAVIGLFSRGGLVSLVAGALMFAWLQQRRYTSLAVVAMAGLLTYAFAPIPQSYFERMETIRTYNEVEEYSALGRLHYWRVALDMTADRPLGVGLKNFESAYDRYDFSNGAFGERRATHNSYLQVLAETGIQGLFAYLFTFTYALILLFRIRRRSRDSTLDNATRRFFYTVSNGLIASVVAFIAGSAFISQAINDLTWLTFALVAALDRISVAELEHARIRVAGDAAISSSARFTLPLQPGWARAPIRIGRSDLTRNTNGELKWNVL